MSKPTVFYNKRDNSKYVLYAGEYYQYEEGYGFFDHSFTYEELMESDSFNTMPTRVVCAAIKFMHLSQGKEIILTGARHFDSLMHETIKVIGRDNLDEIEQGFIDQYGNFLSREKALKIAQFNNQIVRECGDKSRLYSENLY